jgi:pimeloyl-ACP methyl ester carboxylesterase
MTGVSLKIALSTVRSADGTPIAYQSIGGGRGLIIVGGALRTGEDYVPLAQELASSFAVHVMDRRGRGGSGPQGPNYSIDKEVDDLLAVQAATGASAVFGHSYGGFVALETARRTGLFSQIVAYEPGVSIGGSIPMAWAPRYRELLAAGDTRGAFACFIRGIGSAPRPIAMMPTWYLRTVLRLVLRKDRWERMERLLEANVAEHEQEARLDDGTVDRYRSIRGRVLLLGGSKSPAFLSRELLPALHQVIGESSVEILDGLDHFAPDEKAQELVAEKIRSFLSATS